MGSEQHLQPEIVNGEVFGRLRTIIQAEQEDGFRITGSSVYLYLVLPARYEAYARVRATLLEPLSDVAIRQANIEIGDIDRSTPITTYFSDESLQPRDEFTEYLLDILGKGYDGHIHGRCLKRYKAAETRVAAKAANLQNSKRVNAADLPPAYYERQEKKKVS